MKNIEKKFRYGWTLTDFLNYFHCDSEEELFKLLRKEYSRKTVNSYIKRMKKKSSLKQEETKIKVEKTKNISNYTEKKVTFLSDQLERVEEEMSQKYKELTTEKQTNKKGVMTLVVNFFKKLIK